MSTIAVIGGTGYAGGNIVAEAVLRGDRVVSVARSVPEEPRVGVVDVAASLLDVPGLLAAVGPVDAVVVAAAPRGNMEGKVRPAIAELARLLPERVRLGVIGGAGGSLSAPGGPRLLDVNFPEEFKAEALEMAGVLDDLIAIGSAHDWFFVHPAEQFGAWTPGERTGTYRVGGDVVVRDENGLSRISGADLAVAVVDELHTPTHRGARFTVGY